MFYDFLGSDPEPENLTRSGKFDQICIRNTGDGGGGLNFILCSFLLFSTDNSTGHKGGGGVGAHAFYSLESGLWIRILFLQIRIQQFF